MLKKILAAVVILVVALVVLVATRPGTFRVERSVVIEASIQPLYDTVADLSRWDRWSPWSHLDPAQKVTIEGGAGRVGTSYAWAGNDQVGEGRMTITAVRPPLQVRMKLEFLKPWPSTSETVFDLFAESTGTRVVWTMTGDLDFIGKAMCLVKDMDKMVGPDFERGLATLKKGTEDGSLR